MKIKNKFKDTVSKKLNTHTEKYFFSYSENYLKIKVTGNQKVDVSMGLSITDVSKPLAGVVASDTVVASGSGQDSITASNNAIKEASTEVAKLVVNMLNSKGIN